MANVINATSTGNGGLVSTGDDSGILNIQTNETTAITVDASQRVAFVAGTAALPALTTDGDTNTGIFFPAADTIAFSEGGAEAMRIDSSGNVGIGTASPTGKLNVVTDNTHNGGSTFDSTGTTQAWFRDTDAGSNLKNWGIQSSGGDFNIIKSNDDRASGFVTPVYLTTTGNFAFNSGYGSAAIAYGCRAWVNFNGTGTPSIRASGNVSSITDNGTGNYTINFTNALVDANYSVSGIASDVGGTGNRGLVSLYTGVTNPAAGSFRIFTFADTTQTDNAYIYVSVFR